MSPMGQMLDDLIDQLDALLDTQDSILPSTAHWYPLAASTRLPHTAMGHSPTRQAHPRSMRWSYLLVPAYMHTNSR